VQNVVALGAGFTDGMKYGDNTKAAVIRLGLMEMVAFTKLFFPGFAYTLYIYNDVLVFILNSDHSVL